jgi:DMSO/TMAO reductase YedYZ molybdopterin-dependent catalytic subunit
MTERTSHVAPALSGALAGGLAATAGILAGEAVAAALDGVTGPVLAVGNRAVDWAPRPVKEWAVQVFGTADKPVLVGGVVATVGLAALFLGVLGTRRPRWAIAGFTGLVAVAAVAILTDRAATALWPVRLPAVLAILLVGTGGLGWMLTTLRRPAPGGSTAPAGVDRRAFLAAAGAVAAAGAAGGAVVGAVGGAAAATSRRALTLPGPGSAAPAMPSGVTFDVPGLTPYLTPTADFYRVDTALQVPDVPLDGYRLRIHGLVDTPLDLSFEDLLARPLVERRITLTCVSNPVGGDYVGNATWLGVPMRDLLAEAGVLSGADAVRSTSADDFTAGTPLSALTDDRGALLAVGMNGEPLPLEHGFPVRMVTPGLYGYVSATKWLVDLEVTRFADFRAYWTERGYAEQAPIKVSSRIDVPRSFATLASGPTTVAGVAWAQDRGVERVEVRVDGEDWQQADLGAEDTVNTWRPWRWTWSASPGLHRVEVRATDRSGTTQTSQREPIAPDGSTGWHSVTVTVR